MRITAPFASHGQNSVAVTYATCGSAARASLSGIPILARSSSNFTSVYMASKAPR